MSEVKSQRNNRLIIAGLVFMMGLFIFSPQAYIIYNHYFKVGEIHQALYVNSAKVSNTKDTVMLPHYQVIRSIGPLKQNCTFPLHQYIHALDGKPIYSEVKVKLGDKCEDLVVIQDAPNSRLILALLGALIALTGLWLFKKAVKESKNA
jgi:hypothetical protein